MVTRLGPAEYFALMVFAIACLGSMMSQNPIKSLLAALIGLSLATVEWMPTLGNIVLRLIAYIYRMACSLSSWQAECY